MYGVHVGGGKGDSATAQGRNGSRIGPSVLILRYVVEDRVECFSLEMVRYYWLERGVDVDRRRYHDSAMRLVRRGILEKRGRGWYCVRDWAWLHAYLERVSRLQFFVVVSLMLRTMTGRFRGRGFMVAVLCGCFL